MDADASDLRLHLSRALGSAYDLERELGGGGMARVFVARDTRLGRRVVVKVLHPDMSGMPYYVIPFIEGESLRSRLSAGAVPLSLRSMRRRCHHPRGGHLLEQAA